MAVVVQWLEYAVVVRVTRVRFSPSASYEVRGELEHLLCYYPPISSKVKFKNKTNFFMSCWKNISQIII